MQAEEIGCNRMVPINKIISMDWLLPYVIGREGMQRPVSPVAPHSR
jgi:hypothetical protein